MHQEIPCCLPLPIGCDVSCVECGSVGFSCQHTCVTNGLCELILEVLQLVPSKHQTMLQLNNSKGVARVFVSVDFILVPSLQTLSYIPRCYFVSDITEELGVGWGYSSIAAA